MDRPYIFMALGIAVGAGIGVALGNLALGVGIGVGLGLVFATVGRASAGDEKPDQDEAADASDRDGGDDGSNR